MNVKLLDCTLRDGGFVNNWNFGKKSILNIFRGLVNSNIEYIEVGFLDSREEKSLNRTIMPNIKTLNNIFKNESKKNSLILAMIDYGTCDIGSICDSSESFIDGIRIIFKKKDAYGALEFCKQLKEKGYKVFVQPVSVTTYSIEEMIDLVNRVNQLKPYAFSIVDTYGVLNKSNLLSYFDVIEKNIEETISIGFHSHNNLQLSFSNCIELLNEYNGFHTIILDCTLYGMGKKAGNTNTELLIPYLNAHYNKKYNIDEILEIINSEIIKIYNIKSWGYSFEYYLSSINECHPDYVEYLIHKNNLSTREINAILKKLKGNLAFDKLLIEKIYDEYCLKN